MKNSEKLVKWFEIQSEQTGFDTRANYFELGLIDSFDVINLMEYCESEFGVVFSETQFEDRRFATIDGLSCIIDELRNDN